MDINSQYITRENQPALPVQEHMLILDPTSRSTGIKGGEQTTWDIPTSTGANGSYIDFRSSYLSFRVGSTGVATKTARLPLQGVNALVDVVDVESSGYTVEHTTDYANLYSVLADINELPEDRLGYRGFSQGLADTVEEDGTTAVANPERKGALLKAHQATAHATDTRFTIPVPSQCLNSGNHLPVHAISQLRYRITWVKALDGVVAIDAGEVTGFRIEDPKLHLCYLEMSQASRNVITQKSGGLSWSLPMWEVHRANVPAGVTNASFRVPAHKSSIKTLMATFQDTANGASPLNSAGAGTDALSRCNPSVTSFQYRLNGEFYPQQEVKCGGRDATDGVVELMRAFHKNANKTGMISRSNYNQTDKDVEGKCKFALATNVESNTGRSNSSFAGISTLQEAPLLTCKFSASDPATLLNYVQYDTNQQISNGIWKVDM